MRMIDTNQFSVNIQVIEHSKQRYDTVGDWWFDYDTWSLEIRISRMNNWRFEQLVAMHEYVEATLCLSRGIREEVVTVFDKQYELNRRCDDKTSEPGDSPSAPYYKEHQFATSIEKFISHELGVDWDKYEETINNLDYTPAPPVVRK